MIIQSPAPKVSASLDFYSRLKFEEFELKKKKYVSDGKALILINTDRYARLGILLYKEEWSDEILRIKTMVSTFETKEGFIVADSSGTWIYLIKGIAPNIVQKGECHSVLGNFAGISMETLSMARSQSLWEVLGYKVSMGGPDQGWMTMSDSAQNTISLMHPYSCPHQFYNPSLTYFNGSKNPEIIENIRKADVPVTEEITYFNNRGEVDNVYIKDPGGLGFFVFNDG